MHIADFKHDLKKSIGISIGNYSYSTFEEIISSVLYSHAPLMKRSINSNNKPFGR